MSGDTGEFLPFRELVGNTRLSVWLQGHSSCGPCVPHLAFLLAAPGPLGIRPQVLSRLLIAQPPALLTSLPLLPSLLTTFPLPDSLPQEVCLLQEAFPLRFMVRV